MIYKCPHCGKDNKVAGRSVGEAPGYKVIPSTCGFCGKQYQPGEPAPAPKPAPAIPPVADDHDRWRRFRRMAMKMASMIAWPEEETFVRAGGDVLCEECGLKLLDHPEKGGLNLTCDGRLVKL